jgi:hypothetical protein
MLPLQCQGKRMIRKWAKYARRSEVLDIFHEAAASALLFFYKCLLKAANSRLRKNDITREKRCSAGLPVCVRVVLCVVVNSCCTSNATALSSLAFRIKWMEGRRSEPSAVNLRAALPLFAPQTKQMRRAVSAL